MATPSKAKTVYVCSACGYETPKWYGQCPSCKAWNTFEEEIKREAPAGARSAPRLTGSGAKSFSQISDELEKRLASGIGEFDRVLGGGLVLGSVVLISGDPGIGKSTILLQACERYAKTAGEVLYVSGEESPHQLKTRARRLGVSSENIGVLCETDADYICDYVAGNKPKVVVIDSIQTMSLSDTASLPGSVTQVRECASAFMRTAKRLNVPFIIVGHVNKDGNIAGPKVLEHIVDCVLSFEGDRHFSYRLLRAVKNRFGSTNELGVFDMGDDGLREVPNPSQSMLEGRPKNASGSCVACVMEGSRPIMAEVQALVTATGYGTARRMSDGFDYNRLSMLIAVLEKKCGYILGNCDVFVNIVGGLRVDEPATDLTVALAMVSSLKDVVVPQDVIAFGEIGLAGELRSVGGCEQRVREAHRLGFRRCVIPLQNLKQMPAELKNKIELVGASYIRQAFEAVK
ncbi:MAG: DNA repair protein RadA [Clostridia bacterium]|nr:DNA repair protein RadA [Clostridia bacterium]